MTISTIEERLEVDGFEGQDPVLFYAPKDKWGIFSNFSKHEVWLPCPFERNVLVLHATAEHRYQAMKATSKQDYIFVNGQERASHTKDAGRTIQLRPGWGQNYGDLCWFVMFEAVLAKAQQHSEMRHALLLTDDRPIYEDSPVDDIWGVRFRNDYRGKNLLGKVLMQVRAVIAGEA